MTETITWIKRHPQWLIVVLPFILLSPVWLTGRAMYWGTPATQFVPWWWQAWQTLRAGELPLWNPLVGAGAPLLANYQSALFYPPNWLYFLLAALGGLPLMAWGQAILVALHLAWAGWGMGRLARRLGLSDLAQTVSGLAFGLSGYLVARAHFLSINAAVAWLPWILLAGYNLAGDPKRRHFVGKLAVCLGMQWLAGHAQLAWYTLVLALVWVLFWAWRLGRWSRVGQVVLELAIAGLVAFGLTAIQLIPTAEYLLNSQRASEVGFAQAATYSFWPWRLISVVAPNFFGNPVYGNYWGYGNFWEDAVYIGLLPLFLAIGFLVWSFRSAKSRALSIFLSVVSVVAFLLALGKNTPLYAWLYQHVPTFALFQSPTRFSIWIVFSLCLLAGFGLDAWRRPTGRKLYWSRLALAAAIALAVYSAFLMWVGRGGQFAFPETLAPAVFTMSLTAVAFALLHLRAPVEGHQSSAWGWLVLALLSVDLLYAGWGLNPGAPLDLYQAAKVRPGIQQQLGADRIYLPSDDEYRLKFGHLLRFDTFHSADPLEIRQSLLPNTALLDGVASLNNFDPFVPGRYQAWIDALEAATPQVQAAMLASAGVTLVEHVGEDMHLSFETLPALPRARWVQCAQPAAVGEPGSPTEVILVDGINQEICSGGKAGQVSILGASANTVRLLADFPDGGWLLLAETWYPGWQAKDNGDRLEIHPANGLFRAVYLSPGEHAVDFRYRPLSFRVGATSSLATLIFLLTYAMVVRRREEALVSSI